MGSGVWFKNIISKKKGKGARSQGNKKHPAHENGSKEQCSENECRLLANGSLSLSIENAAATRIQTAFRAYLVRKNFHRMRGMARLRNMVKCDFVKKQASNTLSHLHSWSRVQSQIRARRVNMVMESRLKQKKLENQMKLEAKLHDLEVEWSGGFETMDKALAKIHHREEAALKRERAMAYAFSHQWRANSNPSFGPSNQDLSKDDWGWSWMDRWIAARPWETRSPAKESPKKTRSRQPGRNSISPLSKTPANAKLISPNGKATSKVRKLSYEGAGQKTVAQRVSTKAEEVKTQE